MNEWKISLSPYLSCCAVSLCDRFSSVSCVFPISLRLFSRSALLSHFCFSFSETSVLGQSVITSLIGSLVFHNMHDHGPFLCHFLVPHLINLQHARISWWRVWHHISSILIFKYHFFAFCLFTGQFWISPPRYAPFRIVSRDNHTQSRVPVVKTTSLFLGFPPNFFLKRIFYGVTAEKFKNIKMAGRCALPIAHAHWNIFYFFLEKPTRSEQLWLWVIHPKAQSYHQKAFRGNLRAFSSPNRVYRAV